MDQQFFHVASVNFFHEYNGNGRYDGFLTAMSTETRQRLNNLRLLVKPFFGGFHLVSSDPELLSDEQDPILIRLVAKDPLFYNFTDLGQEFRPNSKVFYFSDLNTDQNSGSLHLKDFVTVADSLLVLNQALLKDFLPSLNSGEFKLRDPGNPAVLPRDYTRYFQENGESVFFLENGMGTRGYYKSSQGMEKVPFGVVSLHPDKLYRRIRISGSMLPLQVRFKTRKTIWKYILSDKVFDKFSNLSVIDAQNREISFKEGEFEIQPAWKVRSFESEVEIPFNADFNPRFQLVEKSKDENQAGKVIYKQLPKASPEQLHPLPTNKEVLYSHIFI
ncbi:MAG TPA: hypothetical protein VLA71_02315 [Algoriphagus sp.]|nr:hypothetical protein [Algoriphagus sp.]